MLRYFLSFVLFLLNIHLSFASNFQVLELSAATMGTANAGTGVSDNPSIQFFNPAAMQLIKKQSLSLTTTYISPKLQFRPTLMTRGGVDSLPGSSADDPSHDAVLPMLYYVLPLNDRMNFGMSLTVPYGIQAEYEADSAARYFATYSSIKTLNVNPSFSYQLLPNFAMGLGLNAAELTADLNSIFAAGVNDVRVKNQGSDWGYGWNAGLFYTPNESIKVGLSYRSKISFAVRGETKVVADPPALAVAAALGIADGNARVNITLPETATLSASYRFQPSWRVLGDLQFTRWSRIKEIDLIFGPRDRVKSIITKYYDTYRWATGLEYQWSPNVLLRTGYARDQSPVSSRYRTARMPDNDRTWHSVGAAYHYSKNWIWDFSYSHVLVRPSTIDEFDSNLNHHLFAHYKGDANLYSLQLNYQFA